MRMGSLFSGIGGFDLAAEWMGWRTTWFSEVDPFCNALLAERFPGVPNLGDITTIDWSTVERPDIIAGGFPCQDISYAGKGAGLAGERSGLWYEFARCVREVGPRYVVVENVRALLTRGFDAVLGTLADLGYDAEWSVYGASDVGAPHRRDRVWILAWRREGVGDAAGARRGEGLPGAGGARECGGGTPQPGGRGPDVADAFRITRGQGGTGDAEEGPGGRDVGRGGERTNLVDAGCGRCGGTEAREVQQPGRTEAVSGSEALADGLGERSQGIEQAGTTAGATDGPGDGRHPCGWATEPNVGRVAYGVPARVDRLRGLGNAIVPACALPIFHRIAALEAERVMERAA